MAGRLLWVGLAALLVQGCLLPQEDPVLPDLPPVRNTPPVLVENTANPAQRETVLKLGGTGCMNKDRPFRIGVVDPDLGDTIYSRWYVDHQDFTGLPVNGTGLLMRPTSPERGILTPIELFYTSGALPVPTAVGMGHYVTVVIADRPFPPEGIDLILENLDLPDGGTTPDTTAVAKYTWEVRTEMSCP